MLLPIALAFFQIVAAKPLAAISPEPAAKTRADSKSASAQPPTNDANEMTGAASPAAAKTVEDGEGDGKLEAAYTPGRLFAEPITSPATGEESSSAAPSPKLPGIILNSEASAKQRAWEQRQRRIWLGLSIAQSSAATFDAASTRLVISSGVGTERNPMLQPFAGNGSMYAAVQVGPLLIDYWGRRMLMLADRHDWARHTWWIPQAVGTIVSLYSGVNNMAVYGAH